MRESLLFRLTWKKAVHRRTFQPPLINPHQGIRVHTLNSEAEMDTLPLSNNQMDEQTPSAAQVLGRLAAKELEPLARHVEQVTGTKLHQDTENSPRPLDSSPNYPCGQTQSIDSRCADACMDGTSRLRGLLGPWRTRSQAGDSHRFRVVSENASLHSVAPFGRTS